jgi:hypothetical protein
MRKPMIPALVLLAATGLFALSGCSAPGQSTSEASPHASSEQTSEDGGAAADGDQSLEEACAIANDAALSLQNDTQAALSDPSNQEVVSGAIDTVSNTLSDALDEISNPDVEAAVGDLQSRFESFGQMLSDLQTGTPTQEQASALQSAAADLQTSASNVAELCG